jgi:hypothetical protein
MKRASTAALHVGSLYVLLKCYNYFPRKTSPEWGDLSPG